MQEETGSRQRMIEAAIELMRGSGLSGAGINEVVRESAAPKGSVYHFFPNGKQQLVAEALDAYSPRVMRFMEQALFSGRTPAAKVRRLLEAFGQRVEDADFRKSCAFGTVCLDLDGEHEALRVVVGAAFDRWVELIARHIDLGDARRSRSFAGLVLTAIEGAYIRARAERSSRPFDEAGAWLFEIASQSAAPGRASKARRR
jgi:TetR/AcrR family transcriptional repressor of lmrAB and yxaGH operons